MERSGFFDAEQTGVDKLGNPKYDRTYLASSFASYFSSFISNGVFAKDSTQLQVNAAVPGAMRVVVSKGKAWINGYWYENTENLTLSISPADGTYSRIDAIVLRFGNTERDIKIVVKKGVASSAIAIPNIERSADYYELLLATVFVKAGDIKVSQSSITDYRPDNKFCGWVTGLIKQVDTSTLFNQWKTAYEEYSNEMVKYLEDQKTAWDEFFKKVEIDTVFPVPSKSDVGKLATVNTLANGYTLKNFSDLLSEEIKVGNWSPEIAGGMREGSFMSTRYGKYIKFKDFVYVHGIIVVSKVVTTPSGALTIKNLPFPTTQNTFSDLGSITVNVTEDRTIKKNVSKLIGGVVTRSVIYLKSIKSDSKVGLADSSEISLSFGDSFTISFSGIYQLDR